MAFAIPTCQFRSARKGLASTFCENVSEECLDGLHELQKFNRSVINIINIFTKMAEILIQCVFFMKTFKIVIVPLVAATKISG